VKLGPFDGTGYVVHDPDPHVILSRGRFIYGIITYITKRRKMMVVMVTHWRRHGTIIRNWKPVKYLKEWEEVTPPRKMLAVRGKIVSVAPPN